MQVEERPQRTRWSCGREQHRLHVDLMLGAAGEALALLRLMTIESTFRGGLTAFLDWQETLACASGPRTRAPSAQGSHDESLARVGRGGRDVRSCSVVPGCAAATARTCRRADGGSERHEDARAPASRVRAQSRTVGTCREIRRARRRDDGVPRTAGVVVYAR